MRAARTGEPLDTHDVVRTSRARDDHPGSPQEQLVDRTREPGELATGHRMTADEAQTSFRGSTDDRRLRAGDIRHDRVRRKNVAHGLAELVDELEARQRVCGE